MNERRSVMGLPFCHLADEVHQHLVCEDCGAIIEVSPKVSVSSRHFALSGHRGSCSEALATQANAGGTGRSLSIARARPPRRAVRL